MEDTLRGKKGYFTKGLDICLNPCFNGRYSQRRKKRNIRECSKVLILVLMEDTLRDN